MVVCVYFLIVKTYLIFVLGFLFCIIACSFNFIYCINALQLGNSGMTVLRQCLWYFIISFNCFLILSSYGFYNEFDGTGVVGNFVAGQLHSLFGYFSVVIVIMLFILQCVGLMSNVGKAKPIHIIPLFFLMSLLVGSLNVIFSKVYLFIESGAFVGSLSVYLVQVIEYSLGVAGGFVFCAFVLCFSVLLISEIIGIKFNLTGKAVRAFISVLKFFVKALKRLSSFTFKKKTKINSMSEKQCAHSQEKEHNFKENEQLGSHESALFKNKEPVEQLSSTALVDLLDDSENVLTAYTEEDIETIKANVTDALQDFGVVGVATDVFKGPFVTLVHIELAKGGRLSSVTNLADDLARSLGVSSLRIISAVGGAGKIGIELPNRERDNIYLRPLIQSSAYILSDGLPIALGMDTQGKPFIFDLEKMPHMLVAGSTGTGKSVCLDVFIVSLIAKYDAHSLRLILIDPKMTEFAYYSTLPHLLIDVINDMNRANNAFDWLIGEMDERYKIFLEAGVRSLKEYNKLEGVEKMPRIVVVVDEFADLILVVGKSIEASVQRIAQKARACGIHLVIATQRPSADVITGLIKSNIPGRLSLKVSSKINSRTILEQSGAEQLTPIGDMLVSLNSSTLTRVHCAYISATEIKRVVSLLSTHDAPEKVDIDVQVENAESGALDSSDLNIYKEVIDYLEDGKTYSISGIQRRFRIGYNRSARIFEKLESDGYLKVNASGKKVAVIFE